jgi:hypothetical protein
LQPGDPNASSGPGAHGSDDAFGVGDLLLRTKAVALRDPVDLALGLGVSFPTGNEDDFQGTGTYRVQPSLFVSRTFAERIQPLLNLGVDINANDVDASAFRWAVGATGQIISPLSASIVFPAATNSASKPIRSTIRSSCRSSATTSTTSRSACVGWQSRARWCR